MTQQVHDFGQFGQRRWLPKDYAGCFQQLEAKRSIEGEWRVTASPVGDNSNLTGYAKLSVSVRCRSRTSLVNFDGC